MGRSPSHHFITVIKSKVKGQLGSLVTPTHHRDVSVTDEHQDGRVLPPISAAVISLNVFDEDAILTRELYDRVPVAGLAQMDSCTSTENNSQPSHTEPLTLAPSPW